MARCFVAVWPSPQVIDALAGLPRPATQSLRWTSQEQWHVTLRFFGELTPEEIADATTALAAVAVPSHWEVTAQGGPSTRFLGPGLIIWPVAGLQAMADEVGRATARIGQPVPGRRFYGHLTIARGRRGADLRPGRELLVPLAMSWPVASLSLVQSRLHPDGARYGDLESFPIMPVPSAGTHQAG